MSLSSVIDTLATEKPLFICDVDEVLLHFIAPLEIFLEEHGTYLRKSSFKLAGNIIDRKDNVPLNSKRVGNLIGAFHHAHVDLQPVVAGALDALDDLAKTFQIVFLTNISATLIARRTNHLASLGLIYPVIQNHGSKAAYVKELSSHVTAPTIFIDDLPSHHKAVKTETPDVHCIHFMADDAFRQIAEIDHAVMTETESWEEIVESSVGHLKHGKMRRI